jgi:hypothetical protein
VDRAIVIDDKHRKMEARKRKAMGRTLVAALVSVPTLHAWLSAEVPGDHPISGTTT